MEVLPAQHGAPPLPQQWGGPPPLPADPYPQQHAPQPRPYAQQEWGGPPPPYPQRQQQQQQPGPLPPQQPPGQKRKKRGRRGSGLEARARSLKRGGGVAADDADAQQLGFFGQVPSLDDLRQENWRRTQQHYGGPPRPLPSGAKHGPGRAGSHHRRARGGKAKQAKRPTATPRPVPLTPAAGNPLDTPANVGKAVALGAPAGGGDKAEVEGLQAGLDWYGTNEHSAALFLTGQQLTTSDSEGDDDEQMGGDGEEDDEGSDGEAGGGGGGDDAALPRGVRARLVEQEAYIAELEDQNLRLREQLEMVQAELGDVRARAAGMPPGDSEEGFAEHSEGSLPGDLSVMAPNHHHQQEHSQAH
ncbi:PRLI-interacting factor A [Micractinium conductrix]|uniref:PRLI-interacting factor A n=1 Tax=Micractinium conductrix TaxID=554055 RepID=A0A2P6VL46_9CHLO|nr:PRLI-interacting factor A [Micractinium conductrix]|eukprot:PSC74836.1 PRLI-interacting factor A [Micractinium conductrix]